MNSVAPRTLIFDLSEVVISGLLGIEHQVAQHCGTTPELVLSHLGGEHLWQLCRGQLTEAEYLRATYAASGWTLPQDTLRHLIRQNFARKVAGTEALLRALRHRHELVLLSDHAREWVAHIHGLHPLVDLFSRCFFSFEIGATKAEPAAFEFVLRALDRSPAECLFIDDSARNVAVATSLGIASIRFISADQLAAALRERNLL